MTRICNVWGGENVLWKNGNWTWAECELVQDLCAIWGSTNFLFGNANWKWSECSGSINPPIPPIPVVNIGNRPGVDATTLIQPWLEEPWNPYKTNTLEKQKRLIKLICKVKGQEYDEEKEVKDFKITIGDIRVVVKTVSNIDLDLKLEE